MDSPESTAQAKHTARALARARRRRRTRSELLALEQALTATLDLYLHHHGEPQHVAAFLPMPGEPPILEALRHAHRKGVSIYIPRCLPQRRLEWVCWSPSSRIETSSLAPVEEVWGEATVPPPQTILLVPSLGIDHSGVRLGQGGGFYDSLLQERSSDRIDALSLAPTWAAKAALLFDEELGGPQLPRDPWDLALQEALTPSGVWRLVPPRENIEPNLNENSSFSPHLRTWERFLP